MECLKASCKEKASLGSSYCSDHQPSPDTGTRMEEDKAIKDQKDTFLTELTNKDE